MQQQQKGRLVDAFTDLLTLVVRTMRKPGDAPGFDALRDAVEQRLAEAEQVVASGEVSALDFDQARFAVCAFVDETILATSWEGRKRWLQAPLQKTYYNTVKAGEDFFRRLRHLNGASFAPVDEDGTLTLNAPQDTPLDLENGLRADNRAEVLEVYALCLQLGVPGRYFGDREQIRLKTLRQQTLRNALPDAKWFSPELDRAGKARLTPDVYAVSVPTTPRRLPWDRSRLVSLALFAVPLLTVAVMYLAYSSILDVYLERFLQTASV